MGRASRLKAERRAVRSKHRKTIEGLDADARGLRILPTIEAYEAAARSGADAVKEALIARHNARMKELTNADGFDFARMRAVIAPVGHTVRALDLLGARSDRAPCDYRGSWPDHLAWAVDSVLAAARLAFAGQLVGAALLARQQLERWTENLAFSAGITHRSGEVQADFVQRVWAANESPQAAEHRVRHGAAYGAVFVPWGGDRVWEIYVELSEFAHGRGRFAEAARWDAEGLLRTAPSTPTKTVYGLISDAIGLVISRVRVCADAYAETQGRVKERQLIRTMPAALPSGAHRPPAWSLWPLVPRTGLADPVVEHLHGAKQTFDYVMTTGKRPAGRLFYDDEMMDLLFFSHRSRAATTALLAFEEERKLLGTDFNLDSVHGREHLYVIPSELAGLVAKWWPSSHVGDAAATAGSAIRSAYWLWLEDDDRAMAMLRIVLEQVTRLRTWRLKPEKAQLLEDSTSTTPRDWLDASGFRRLGALVRALGELTHFRPGAKWDAARDLIVDLQPEQSRGEHPEFTGRGEALDRVSIMLFSELIDTVRLTSVTLADTLSSTFDRIGRSSAATEKQREVYLNHVWGFRNEAIEGPSFVGPAQDRARLRKLFGDPVNPYVPHIDRWPQNDGH